MADQAARPLPLPFAPHLVGRDRELATLRAALDAALAGRGSLVLIGGEAGIGKTALAEALCAEAEGCGALVLVGRCYDLAETPPYGPWAEALGHLPTLGDVGALPAPLGAGDTAGNQVALFAQVRSALGGLAARRPLVLLLDDLHWADAVLPAAPYEVGHSVTDFAPGAQTAAHTHPGQVFVTILEGEITFNTQGATKVYKVGETFVDQGGVVGVARNAGAGRATVLATHLLPKGAPFSTPVAMPGLPATGGGGTVRTTPPVALALLAGCALVAAGWLLRRRERRA